MKLLKVGELSREAGITVRALHHYDKIGLLRATGQSESSYRLYNQNDVERLQQIISLKSMGLSLSVIGKCLDEEEYDLLKILTLQEATVKTSIKEQEKVQKTLRIMIEKLKQDRVLTTKELLIFIKEIQTMEKYYTPEQLKKIQDRYEKYPKKVKEVEKAWPILFKKFEDAMKAGFLVTDLKVQVLASEAQHYIDLFTGGDKEIEANLDKFSEENRKNAMKQWNVSEEVYDYAHRARQNIKKLKKD